MTLIQMEYFNAVCQHMNFTKAAKALDVTQPTISAAIRELEQECDTLLIDRQRNRLVLTEAGQVLLEYITPILEHYVDLTRTIPNLSRGRQYIRIGFTTLTAIDVYSASLTRFRRAYPDIQISAIESHNPQLFELLEDNRLDLIFTSSRCADQQQERFGSYHISTSALRFCVSVEHPFAQKESVTWEEIASTPLILLSDRFSMGRSLKERMEHMNLQPKIIHTTDQVYTIERFIENNAACGFLPSDVAVRNRLICGIPYPDSAKQGGLNLLWRRDAYLHHAVREFIEIVKDYSKGLGG